MFHQDNSTDKHSGIHLKRFECWRWESQQESWYGTASIKTVYSSPMYEGSVKQTANREPWKKVGGVCEQTPVSSRSSQEELVDMVPRRLWWVSTTLFFLGGWPRFVQPLTHSSPDMVVEERERDKHIHLPSTCPTSRAHKLR